MTETAQPETTIGEDRRYWTHKVKPFPEPVAQFRMAQLIDFDDRLYETARVVYRFLVGWYHHDHGDALTSQRHVAKVMKQRAPEGAVVPSRNAVQRAIIALMDTGWVVRTAKGRGRKKTASRYVPVINVLELAEQGKFPELAHANGPDEGHEVVAHANGPVFSEPAHSNGPLGIETGPAGGPKTLLPDPATLDSPESGNSNGDVSGAAPPPGLAAAAGSDGFEKIWKAYGRLGNKVAAREALAAITEPDVEHIARRAASWASSAKPGRKRMPLEKWLAAEKYDEADRTVADRPAKPTPVASNDNTPDETEEELPAFMRGSAKLWPKGRHVLQVIDSSVESCGGDIAAFFKFKILDGKLKGTEVEHRIYTECCVQSYQLEGRAILSRLITACDQDGIEDTSELHGLFCAGQVFDGEVRYERLTEEELEEHAA